MKKTYYQPLTEIVRLNNATLLVAISTHNDAVDADQAASRQSVINIWDESEDDE